MQTESKPQSDGSDGSSHNDLSIADVFAFLHSYWFIIAVAGLFGLSLAVAYVVTAKRTYTAVAQLLIETDQQPSSNLVVNNESLAMDTPQIESQIALLQSEQIAGRVAQLLEDRSVSPDAKNALTKSADQKEEATSTFGIDFSWFSKLFSGSSPREGVGEKAARIHAEALAIQGGMEVKRVGLSYVVDVSYSAGTPEKAAVVANAIGDAYVQDKLDIRVQNARRGGTWLEARIEELRQAMNNAALEVQVFKARRDYRLIERPNEQQDKDWLPSLSQSPKANSDPATAPSSDKTSRDGKPAEPPAEQTTLDELQSRAETYRKIYESYLQVYTETVQRQSYPVTNARVITRAEPPTRKSSPKTLPSLAAGLVLGTMAGLGFSLILFSFDHTARSPRQISRNLEMPFLGQVTLSHFGSGFRGARFLPASLRPGRVGGGRCELFHLGK